MKIKAADKQVKISCIETLRNFKALNLTHVGALILSGFTIKKGTPEENLQNYWIHNMYLIKLC